MPFRKLVFSLAALLLTSAPLALAQGTYTQIDYPGATTTFAFGVDTAGDVVGFYIDSSGVNRGFLLSGGVYSTIDYPNSLYNQVYGINDLGQIVGTTEVIMNGHDETFGFVYNINSQTFSTVSYPNSGDTIPTGINNDGTIVGFMYHLAAWPGFELVGSTYSLIKPPGYSSAYVWGISASGEVVGQNFLFYRGKYRYITISNAPEALIYGINPEGTVIVGQYRQSSGVSAGFLYRGKTLTTVQFPGATGTTTYGINSAGEVVGFFADASNNGHGYTWTPPAPVEKK